ncbi:ATP-binding protein [Actinospica robiniae]|uniref:ATP-binding protein n=1 Tax=Actinospica robiniae TaxID=304901 RepID=UPI00041FEC11|nr:helix-turn-helix domain-containing protein [Actinospica robiniae]
MAHRSGSELPDDLEPPFRALVNELRILKNVHHLTLEDLSARTHYGRSSWERWLNGKRLVTRSAVESLTASLGIDDAALLSLLAQVSPGPRTPHEDAPAHEAEPRATAGAISAGPFQLPADIRTFTGRAAEIAELERTITETAGQSDWPVVCSVDGMGGMGKSALAVHVAHRVSGLFPDGRLYLDLHGHTPGFEPLEPVRALLHLLRSLGVAPEQIPEGVDARAACLRDRVHGRRIMILLDNAANAAQVRPLLPGSAGCLVVITSRVRMVDLDDVLPVSLPSLADTEALDLFVKIANLGPEARADPRLVEIVRLCGNIPLAIRMTAARVRHHPALGFDAVIEDLRDERGRLEALRTEDRDVAAALELSYSRLPERERLLFRRLALVPGVHWDAYAAANLLGTDMRTAARVLESIHDHNLLIPCGPGRYGFHDLVRLFARSLFERAGKISDDDERAYERLLGYYLQTTAQASDLSSRMTRSWPVSRTPAPCSVPQLASEAASLAWLRTERVNLIAAIVHSHEQGRHQVAHTLLADLAGFLLGEGHWEQSRALHQHAAARAEDEADPLWQGIALMHLSTANQLSGNNDGACSAGERALDIFEALDHSLARANAQVLLAGHHYMAARLPAAEQLATAALETFTELSDLSGESRALWTIGRVRYAEADLAGAADRLTRAVELAYVVGDTQSLANRLVDLGRVYQGFGDLDLATSLYLEARSVFAQLGRKHGEANVLWNLGRVHLELGRFADAAEALEEARALYAELGSRNGEAYALLDLGRLFLARERTELARLHFERARDLFRDIRQLDGIANAELGLGNTELESGRIDAAGKHLECALSNFRTTGDQLGQRMAGCGLADLAGVREGAISALDRYTDLKQDARKFASPSLDARIRLGEERWTRRL